MASMHHRYNSADFDGHYRFSDFSAGKEFTGLSFIKIVKGLKAQHLWAFAA
jgi:hypothetical protein